ncbi:MAG: hypothetical protein HY904_19940 [Deltaproteobacteria bacterium]|nr:hypothetical protein [Deltaproteobacteria bacterium]
MTNMVRLSILDSYGVRWSRETFVRDLVQNFYDATPDFRDVRMDLDRSGRTVAIHGPAVFDLDLLAYVGATTKREGTTAGGFGEGFKICALVGTRDFGLEMSAASGGAELSVTYDAVPLGRELCYRVVPVTPPHAGSHVMLRGCDDELLALFDRARHLFRHPDNPHLHSCLTGDATAPAAVFRAAAGEDGLLFYRRQLRGRVSYWGPRGLGRLTFVHDGVIDALEGDRDRRDIPCTPLVHAVGMALAPAQLQHTVMEMMPVWKHGNEVLTALLQAMVDRELTFSWPAGWLARERDDRGLGALAERQGFQLARADFALVGMKKATEHFTEDLQTRAPTPLERGRLQAVVALHGTLTQSAPREKEFEVFKLAGAAVKGQHLGKRVIVAEDLIAQGFDACAPTILHELAHERGGEESNGFLTALTGLLGSILRDPAAVTAARERFAAVTGQEEAAPAPPPVPKAYAPENDWDDLLDRDAGVACAVYVPPAFPPTTAILEGLRAAGERAGIPVFMGFRLVVDRDSAARRNLLTGLPRVRIGTTDFSDVVPPFSAQVDAAGLVVDVEGWAAALKAGQAAGLTGYRGLERMGDAIRERARALGVAPPEQPTDVHDVRRKALRALAHDYRSGGWGLQGAWGTALLAAADHLVEQRLEDERPAAEVYADIQTIMERALALARGLRGADEIFDDADRFERNAMAAAQGVAVCAAVTRPERMVEQFAAVRALTERLLDLPVCVALKEATLEHALEASGLAGPEPHVPLDLQKLAAEAERACAAALAWQRRLEEEGRLSHMLDAYDFKRSLEPPGTPHTSRPPDLGAIARTHRARDAHAAALAEGLGELEAARRAFAVMRVEEP